MSPVETLASWSAEPPPQESWTERLSLSNAITVMVILALLAGLYVFHREVGQRLMWLGEAMGGASDNQVAATSTQPSRVPPTTVPNAPSAANDGAASSQNPLPQAPEQPETSSPPLPAQALENHEHGARRTSADSPNGSSPVTPLSGMTPAGNSEGQAEYEKAMQILHGKNASVDAPEALRLLWISVEKGNPNAELELADMYWKGRGVIQNCDQTLILLTAAARKGNAEAQKRLLQYRKQGCE
jgi:TPR repeat protein